MGEECLYSDILQKTLQVVIWLWEVYPDIAPFGLVTFALNIYIPPNSISRTVN